jgi:tetratricopeptide (TPR) repeat protein
MKLSNTVFRKLSQLMSYPSMKTSLVVLVCLLFCFLASAYQQPDSTSQGIALYEQGDLEGAIKVLREAAKKSKKDPKAWHYLGLAFFRQGKLKEAREALEKAIGLRELAIKMEFGRDLDEWRDDQLENLKSLLSGQIEDHSKLLETLTDPEALEFGELALARSRIQAECVEANTRTVAGHSQLKKSALKFEKAHVLSKQEPRYSESARRDQVSGKVVLKVIFAADASIQHIQLMQSPDSRLTEESIRAARLIRFTPETICGKPVSSPVQVEYDFYISP